MRSGARRLAVVPLSALVLLAGCGGGDPTETAATGTSTSAGTTSSSAGTPSATTTAPATDEVTDAPPFPADTSPDTGEAVAGEGPTVVTAVRVGSQDGADRVVLDLAGTAVPGWDVAYTDAPTQEGSGSPVEMPGTVFLRVTLTGVTNPYEAPGTPETARGVYPGPSGGPVQAIYYDSVFEGQALAYLGLDAERPFRVYALSNPTRIVVDVQR
ncbi:AMIN-like domain-containing (lipo)protein [Klenkia taihuensis]|uniref:AMIN-like domain-containing protein n=1 Tax=Klenkia taihuensis TaxID=1225127 RepID=A0A1I1IVL6_9ACTN|nr:hypothetical protein [Klenkia taihuensis]GHE11258.1 hypothetical protein GCM10011381_24040 [Klenkia taihuensis]SFC39941.1 hypothetical protein SAMN05661030_0872 [Klenkia taihuensis]